MIFKDKKAGSQSSKLMLLCPNCNKSILHLALQILKEEICVEIKCSSCLNKKLLSLQNFITDFNGKCKIHTRMEINHFCNQCKKWFCQECFSFHLVKNRKHTVTVTDKALLIRCTQHNLPFSFYCTLCHLNLCQSCHLICFQSHQRIPIKEIESIDKQINEFNTVIVYNKDRFDMFIKQIERQFSKSIQMKTEIQAVFQKYELIIHNLMKLYQIIQTTFQNSPCFELMEFLQSFEIINLTPYDYQQEKIIEEEFYKLKRYFSGGTY